MNEFEDLFEEGYDSDNEPGPWNDAYGSKRGCPQDFEEDLLAPMDAPTPSPTTKTDDNETTVGNNEPTVVSIETTTPANNNNVPVEK